MMYSISISAWVLAAGAAGAAGTAASVRGGAAGLMRLSMVSA
jgi:hypothetical protein